MVFFTGITNPGSFGLGRVRVGTVRSKNITPKRVYIDRIRCETKEYACRKRKWIYIVRDMGILWSVKKTGLWG